METQTDTEQENGLFVTDYQELVQVSWDILLGKK